MALQCDGKAVRGLLWSFLHHLLPDAHWWHSATPSSSPGLCLARCTNPNRIYTNMYTDACVGFEEMSFSSQPRMQSKYYSRNVFLGCSGFFRRIEFQMTTMTRRLKCWLSALAAVVHVRIIQTAGRAVQKKNKKKGGGLQFPDSLSNFNVNTLELQLKVSALTSQLRFHLKLERGAWNERKRLHLLIQSDCADGVFMEIHQVCDKNLYLSGQLCHAHRCNEAATRTGSLNSGLKLAPFWHQGCFDPFVCSN